MKPIILTFIRYYLPGYLSGGPVRTVANMVDRLSDEFDFRIITLDHDFGSDHSYIDMPSDTWTTQGDAQVRYVSIRKFGLREVGRILRETPHDVVYLNSFFEPRFTLQILINRLLRRCCDRPIVIAPRGEFSVGALSIKAWKKRFFIKLARISGLYANVTWQASSEWEAADIRRALSLEGCQPSSNGANQVVIAPDLAASHEHVWSGEGQGSADGALLACTLSRISPMKNLDFTLRALALVRVPVRFSIYGPIEDSEYWSECQELIRLLPAHIQVKHEGTVEPAKVMDVLAQFELFILPTKGENFGHVIHEALHAGLPVLISDQTPWRQLAERGVGWDVPLNNLADFAQKIEEVAGWPDELRSAYTTRARAMASDSADDPTTLRANKRLFFDVIDGWSLGVARRASKGDKNV